MKYKLFHSITLGACLLAATAANAAGAIDKVPTAQPYQMAALVNRASGYSVMAGEYTRVIEKLSTRKYRTFESSTNLCVAYALTGELASAEAECAAAVEKTRNPTQGQMPPARNLAVALSNLGVVNAMSGDMIVAVQHFTEALSLDQSLEQASANLTRAEQKLTLTAKSEF